MTGSAKILHVCIFYTASQKKRKVLLVFNFFMLKNMFLNLDNFCIYIKISICLTNGVEIMCTHDFEVLKIGQNLHMNMEGF